MLLPMVSLIVTTTTRPSYLPSNSCLLPEQESGFQIGTLPRSTMVKGEELQVAPLGPSS